jgi:hypothetical protein
LTDPTLGAYFTEETNMLPLSSALRSPERRSPRRFARPALEELERRDTPSSLPRLVVGPNINTGHMDGNQSEPAIGINPTNPSQLFVATNDNAANSGLYASYSTDGGQTWHPRVIAGGNDNLPGGFTDPSVAWDTFGNLFFSYIDNAAANVIICLSTNGGVSFNAIATIPVADQPHLAVGANMVWVVFNNGSLQADGAPVTGLGVVGAFIPVETIPNSVNGNFGGIAISPTGQVTVCFQNAASGSGPDTIRASTDPDGLGPLGFTNPVVASPTNVGGFRAIPAQPVRTVDAESKLAYDSSNGPHRGRLYMTYTDAPSVASNSLNIFLRFSDDNGATWSAPIKCNDDTTGNSHFFSYLSLDPTTGNLAITWYDCRNSPNNTTVEVFATVTVDGGQSVLPNVQVAAGLSSANAAGNNNGNDYGDYMGVTFFQGSFYPVWIDNSTALPGNTNLPTFDVGVARVQLLPPKPIPPIKKTNTYYPFRYVFDPRTGEYRGNLVLQNTGNVVLSGTFVLTFHLPPGVTLLNANGTDPTTGLPTITFTATLPPALAVRLPIRLLNRGHVPLSTFFEGFPIDVTLPP